MKRHGKTKMLLNHFMFWMMMTEATICLVLSLPFGQWISHAVISFLMKNLGGKDSPANMVATVVLAVVSILFLSDVSTVYKHHSSDEVLSDGMRIRLLTAQRDMYITGFCLFLFLLLRLVYIALATNLRLEKSLGAMKKQAEGAAAGYKSLLAENETFKKQTEKLHELFGDEEGEDKKKKVDALARLVQENADLEQKVKASADQLKKAENEVAAVTKQAEGQSSAFMKLMDEKNASDKQLETAKAQEEEIKRQREQIAKLTEERDSLKTQIQDYDFMFSEAKKKAE
ncbi:B-cell receptor-associated protein 29 [Phytophthora citrophthora]|uniref:Endoplasmic reticulum transmembrane protein n=1 Tax=Phytophthora citrophthora TaxID=4793 RepID=A0AAD9LN38_9STRA|nr:B-cell receptor-associated protein 29 [Phytophthora citrophthora]